MSGSKHIDQQVPKLWRFSKDSLCVFTQCLKNTKLNVKLLIMRIINLKHIEFN